MLYGLLPTKLYFISAKRGFCNFNLHKVHTHTQNEAVRKVRKRERKRGGEKRAEEKKCRINEESRRSTLSHASSVS